MACATLKRNLEWDSMSQMPVKRRRCAPFSTSPGLKVAEPSCSVFGETVSAPAKLSSDRIAQELCDDIKRLRRRRQLRLVSGVNVSSSSSGSEGDSSPPHHSQSAHNQKVHKALFTFKQVRLICERMLREQEVALRSEYETALSKKLAEQYEAFVRFNIDQVQRRPPPTTCMSLGMDTEHYMHQDLVPSYLS